MTAEKSVSVSFRVTRQFKELLERAAEHEHRSQTNMLESLLFEHCNRHGIGVATARATTKKAKTK